MSLILRNAIESIQIGVEDFSSSDQKRMLSAVRNVTSGIILLFKEKLRQLSPPESEGALIKQQVLPIIGAGGQVTFRGKGEKTVDVYQIEERFEALGVSVAWKKFRRLTDIRNKIEHYYLAESHDQAREALSDAFVVMKDFILNELGHQPRNLLGDKTWLSLLDISSVFEKEYEFCKSTIGTLDWHKPELFLMADYLSCPSCDSSLIRTTSPADTSIFRADFLCTSCGLGWKVSDLSEAAVSEAYFGDAYIAASQGGEAPVWDCRDCGSHAYLMEADICASCGATAVHYQCPACASVDGDEGVRFGELCGYHASLAARDD